MTDLLCYYIYICICHMILIMLSDNSRTPHQLENFYMVCEARQKLATLIHILRERAARGQKVMVFLSTCAMVEYFAVAVKRCAHILSDESLL